MDNGTGGNGRKSFPTAFRRDGQTVLKPDKARRDRRFHPRFATRPTPTCQDTTP